MNDQIDFLLAYDKSTDNLTWWCLEQYCDIWNVHQHDVSMWARSEHA